MVTPSLQVPPFVVPLHVGWWVMGFGDCHQMVVVKGPWALTWQVKENLYQTNKYLHKSKYVFDVPCCLASWDSYAALRFLYASLPVLYFRLRTRYLWLDGESKAHCFWIF